MKTEMQTVVNTMWNSVILLEEAVTAPALSVAFWEASAADCARSRDPFTAGSTTVPAVVVSDSGCAISGSPTH